MPGPTPERNLVKRLLQLEQQLRQLLRSLVGQREAQLVPRPQTRIGLVVESSGVFPAAPANTFGIIFCDGDFLRSPGLQTPTLALHAGAPQAVAHNLCGHYIRVNNRVIVVEINRRWWIVRDFGPARFLHFTVDQMYGFATTDETVHVAVTHWFGGSDPDPDAAGIDVTNPCGIFEGANGVCGLAVYDDVLDRYEIWQLYCSTYPGGA